MPPLSIVPSCREIVQRRLEPQLPTRWHHQFRFGIQALTLKPFSSLASNARQTVANVHPASTKMDRLVGNDGLATAMSQAVASLGFIRPTSIVACDHSDFNGLMAFVGAVQTNQGRAIPCLVATTYSPRLSAWDHAPKRVQRLRAKYRQLEEHLYGQAVAALESFAGQLGFWPRLVFDRGFGGLPLIQALVRHHATFYVRLKAHRFVDVGGTRLHVAALASPDRRIRLGGVALRVVRSDAPDTGEPWYILTSDLTSSRSKILAIYAHRFEIEETFKDLKHVLDLDATRLNSPASLKVLLWFASLSLILAFLVLRWTVDARTGHPKKRCSHYRRFVETLTRELLGPRFDLITGGL